jgi:hypothetical protein
MIIEDHLRMLFMIFTIAWKVELFITAKDFVKIKLLHIFVKGTKSRAENKR